jgi:hypothetical protein
MKRKSTFRNHYPSLLLTFLTMAMSALVIYKVFPKPRNGATGCKQEQNSKCSASIECIKNK